MVRLLFRDPTKQLYVREIARASNLSLGTVQQELAKLGAVDLVKSRTDGYHGFFRANRAHQKFADLQHIALRGTPARAFISK